MGEESACDPMSLALPGTPYMEEDEKKGEKTADLLLAGPLWDRGRILARLANAFARNNPHTRDNKRLRGVTKKNTLEI